MVYSETTREEIDEFAKSKDFEELSDMIENSVYPHRAFLQRCLAAKVAPDLSLYEEHVRESVYKDFNPKNEFFDEIKKRKPNLINEKSYEQVKSVMERKEFMPPGSLGLYYLMKDLNEFEKGREEYAKNISPFEDKIRRKQGLEHALKNKDRLRDEMEDITNKWDRLLNNKQLVKSVNISLSFKMANILKEDPSLYELVPDRIKDNPASPLAEPLYKEWRFYEERYPENIKDIMLNEEKDYRKMGLIHLRSDAKRDADLRLNPERAEQERNKLKNQRRMKNAKKEKEMEL